MPYIKSEKRDQITPVLKGTHQRIEMENVNSAGDLNYAFTALAIDYLKRKGLNYQNINDIVGALESAKAEFQRRIVGPYEIEKTQQNGDVYDVYLKIM